MSAQPRWLRQPLLVRGQGSGAARPGVLFGIALLAVMIVVPPLVGGYLINALTSYLISGMLALAVGLITGYGRLFNLGVGANFGVSAYTVAILTHQGTTNPIVLLLAAVLAGVVVSLLFAFYALTSSGIEYLMLTFLTTLAFAAIPLATLDLTGGDNGLTVVGGLQVSFGLSPLAGTASTGSCLAWSRSVLPCRGSCWPRRPAGPSRPSDATRRARRPWAIASRNIGWP